jgi:hypothetical protein
MMTRVSGVYLNSNEAAVGARELESAGFVPWIEMAKQEREDLPSVPEQQAPPLDGMGLSIGLQGTEPVRAREQAEVPESWVSGETTVAVDCEDEDAVARALQALRLTEARNVKTESRPATMRGGGSF